jgi:hypothetical protein
MNFFKSILSHIKTWFSSPATLANEAHAAKMALDIAAPGLVLVLQEAGASDTSGEVQKVTTEISADLTNVDTILTGVANGTTSGETAAQEIVTVLDSAKGNIGLVLAMAHIKNSAKVATITNTATAVINEVDTIIGEFSSAPAVSGGPVKGTGI